MNIEIAYILMIITLGLFGYIGYKAASKREINNDEYLSARGTQNSMSITLSLLRQEWVFGFFWGLRK